MDSFGSPNDAVQEHDDKLILMNLLLIVNPRGILTFKGLRRILAAVH